VNHETGQRPACWPWRRDGKPEAADPAATHPVDPGYSLERTARRARRTSSCRGAREHGCGVVEGVEMLVQLAMQLFTLWTCIVPEEEVFQKAVAGAPMVTPAPIRPNGWEPGRILSG